MILRCNGGFNFPTLTIVSAHRLVLQAKKLITEHKNLFGPGSRSTSCWLGLILCDLTPLKRFIACSLYLYSFSLFFFSFPRRWSCFPGKVLAPLLLLSNKVSPWELTSWKILTACPETALFGCSGEVWASVRSKRLFWWFVKNIRTFWTFSLV